MSIRQTIPACMTKGTYTIQTNGVSQTESTCQLHKASSTCFWATRSHPKLKKEYPAYFISRIGIDVDEEEMARGTPSKTDKVAAREKLSSVIMDMTVEAMQRLRAFRTTDIEAVSWLWADGSINASNGGDVVNTNVIGQRILPDY